MTKTEGKQQQPDRAEKEVCMCVIVEQNDILKVNTAR